MGKPAPKARAVVVRLPEPPPVVTYAPTDDPATVERLLPVLRKLIELGRKG